MSAALPPDAIERAAGWLAALQDERAGAAEREACARWRAEHPDHDRAYRRLESLWHDFDGAASCASPATARRIIEQAVARPARRRAAGLAALALLAAGGLLGWRLAPPAWLLADHHTRVGQWRVVELEDHSRITLNTDSAIDVRYDARQRLVTLRQGEILVEVAPEPAGRPFVVQTPDGTASALGTRYVVRREPGQTRVAVTESRVRACAAGPAAPCADLQAGQRVRMGGGRLDLLAPVDPDRAEAWSRHTLSVDDQPLDQVLDELARYRPGRLQFDAQALAGMRVSGVFPLDDTDRALASLAASLPLDVRRYTPWLVVVRRR